MPKNYDIRSNYDRSALTTFVASKGAPPYKNAWRAYDIWKVIHKESRGLKHTAQGCGDTPIVSAAGLVADMYKSSLDAPISPSAAGWNTLVSECENIALGKLHRFMREQRSAWDAAVTAGEMRETVSMLVNTAQRVARAGLALKKGRLWEAGEHLLGRYRYSTKTHYEVVRDSMLGAKPRRRLRKAERAELHRWIKEAKRKNLSWALNASEMWLTYRYGWRPLIYDLHTAARHLAERAVKGELGYQKISAKGSYEKEHAKASIYTPLGHAEWKNEVQVRLTILAKPNFTKVGNSSWLSELGFSNPASLAWELLPLSFVVDWFVNVGDVLSSIHEFSQWTVIRGQKSVFLRQTWQSRVDEGVSVPLACSPWFKVKYTGNISQSRVETRAVRSAWTLPTSLKLQASNPLDTTSPKSRIADALSLLAIAFSGSKPPAYSR